MASDHPFDEASRRVCRRQAGNDRSARVVGTCAASGIERRSEAYRAPRPEAPAPADRRAVSLGLMPAIPARSGEVADNSHLVSATTAMSRMGSRS